MLDKLRQGHRLDQKPLLPSGGVFSPTLLAAILAVAWFVFTVLSIWFVIGDHRLDQILLFGLASPTESSGHFDRVFGIAWSLTALGSPEVVALFSSGIVGYLVLAKRFEASLFVLATVGGGTLFGYAAKTAFGFIRPHHEAGSQDVMLNTSFPSGHALLAALFFISIAVLLVRQLRCFRTQFYVSACAVAAITLVGASRVYLGLHWPSDVLAGWTFGIGWIALVALLFVRLDRITGESAEAEP